MSFRVPLADLKVLREYARLLAQVEEADFTRGVVTVQSYEEFRRSLGTLRQLKKRDPGGNVHL